MYSIFQQAVKEAQDALNKQKDLLKARNKDISERTNEKKFLEKEHNAAQLKIQELDYKVTKCTKESQDASRTVS